MEYSWDSSETLYWWKIIFNSNVYAGLASVALTSSFVLNPTNSFRSIKDVNSSTFEKIYDYISEHKNVKTFSGLLIVAAFLDLLSFEKIAELVAFLTVIIHSLPYLLKPSVLRRDKSLGLVLKGEDLWRPFADTLVYTSLFYAAGGVLAFWCGMPGLGALHFYTCFGSTMFHSSRETMFFNWDNIGAFSLLFVAMYCVYLSLSVDYVWTCFGIICILVGGALLAICGMPGILCQEGCSLRRKSCPRYSFYHTVWHVVSAAATCTNVLFLHKNFPGLDAGGGNLPNFPSIPMVPFCSVCCAICINLVGNAFHIMPLK